MQRSNTTNGNKARYVVNEFDFECSYKTTTTMLTLRFVMLLANKHEYDAHIRQDLFQYENKGRKD